jgi:two-component system OmpR family response regulator
VNSGRVVSRSQILEHVWQFDFDGDSSIIESFISNIRKKVDRVDPKLIHTVRGIGYTIRTR